MAEIQEEQMVLDEVGNTFVVHFFVEEYVLLS
jgi:hypothetical protein